MTEPVTQSQLSEVLETVKAIQSQLTELTLEVKVGQAEIREKFNTMEAKIEAVRLEVQNNREQLVELGKRQSSTDNRLWALLVALFLMVAGLLAKITLFDRV
ncbi:MULTISPECIES: hypothetical protein [unclassified Thermosynechococcus]|uniref:hypothetical protein n=1 Tax=unclassified Thermosynechococcus TaxID=2622553 RepID=UPI002873DBB4|nr:MULTISPECIES: hypothetical protein [unclassified Thermosynechococcus]WNC31883.1 hypothetical protein RHH81_09580 [Thermosynechococcus sp. PKX95]WNC34410.1 hypothetical protein RHH79_09575 [Thermosynechococcus sp. PKX91]WNC36930.1 hypothetical protein RHI11_09570 [Thermosynechococcus sp. WL11]WNC39451.1 hypothetical protein RHI18_09570 [Thermosynechococcus sp. WL17]WNC41972.1 hypothetical protein RHI14_09560 [Thermosynechococcus sp. WL15]